MKPKKSSHLISTLLEKLMTQASINCPRTSHTKMILTQNSLKMWKAMLLCIKYLTTYLTVNSQSSSHCEATTARKHLPVEGVLGALVSLGG